jgi:DNA-binding NtrC family response regulator
MLDIFAEQLKLKNIELLSRESQIAIIDDDPSFSIMMKDYLMNNCDYNTELFENGESFLESYKRDDKRILILDYEFEQPNAINGLAILKKIKMVNPDAIVIIVSGQDSIETAIETMRNGASDYFLKSNRTVFANVMYSILKLLQIERIKLN